MDGQVRHLPERWAAFLVRQGETGMGYQTGNITLADGRFFEDVIIVGGCITKVRGQADIPFDGVDVVKIEITGRRWDWDE